MSQGDSPKKSPKVIIIIILEILIDMNRECIIKVQYAEWAEFELYIASCQAGHHPNKIGAKKLTTANNEI